MTIDEQKKIIITQFNSLKIYFSYYFGAKNTGQCNSDSKYVHDIK